MERSEHSIKIWFWARDNPSVPSDVSTGASVVDPDGWVRNDKRIQCRTAN